MFGLRIDDVTKENFFDIVLLYQYNVIAKDFAYLDGFEKMLVGPWKK